MFTPFSLDMLTAAVHTDADSGMTAFILNRLLLENSSFTLAVVILLVFSDIVLEASEMETPSLAGERWGEKMRGEGEGEGRGIERRGGDRGRGKRERGEKGREGEL